MMGELQDIKVLLRDDLYESKDWQYSDTLGRVEWLIGMVASKNEEIEIWLEQINQLRDALRWAAPYVKDDPRVSAIIKATLKEEK